MSNKKQEPRKIFIARHGERIDFTFKKWIEQCFDSNNHYSRIDLNMPKNIPVRQNGKYGFVKGGISDFLNTLR